MTDLENQLLYFNIDNEKFGLRLTYVSEIFEVNSIEEYPTQSQTIVGITNIRNEVVTLINTKEILYDKQNNWTKENCLNKHIILLNTRNTNKQIGLIVDSVDKVTKMKNNSIDTTVFTNDNTIEGVFKKEDKIIPIVNIPEIEFN